MVNESSVNGDTNTCDPTEKHYLQRKISRGCEINCVNSRRIVKLLNLKGILWLTGHRKN
jgi:hypothetical protein